VSPPVPSVRFMLFDAGCPICGSADPRARREPGGVCRSCAGALGRPPGEPAPPGLERCRALTSYEGTGRLLVTRLKFHNRRSVVPFVATQLADQLVEDALDVVTWAPTAPHRRRQRGFDQAEVLARALARRLRIPARRCLIRLPGPAQTGRHRDERFRGPRFDTCRGVASTVGGRRVALVDDVATTGATLSRAAEVLRWHGAAAVVGVVVARTPRAGTAGEARPVHVAQRPAPGRRWVP